MLFTKSIMRSGNLDALNAKIEQELQEHRSKYFFQGVMFIVAGIAAAAFPVSTAFNVEFIIGIILLLTGIGQLVLTLKARMHWWSLLSAVLSMGIGLILLWQPLPMLMAFVTVLALFMTIEGVLEIMLSFQFSSTHRWNWMFSSGVVTLILATILWIGSPIFDALYLGWIIALNLIFYGASLLMLISTVPTGQQTNKIV